MRIEKKHTGTKKTLINTNTHTDMHMSGHTLACTQIRLHIHTHTETDVYP